MKSRQAALLKLVAVSDWHPAARPYTKLSCAEQDQVTKFILENQNLSDSEYEMKCNRWFLDVEDKPKHYKEMISIVSACMKGV